MSSTYQKIIQDVKGGKLSPVYFFSGEEIFFIDELEKVILKSVLQPGTEDFNLDILYGKDISSLNEVITICQQYPVFSERRLVILREAQHLNRKESWEPLASYLQQPMGSTTLVILFKHKSLDKRWDVSKKIMAASTTFEAVKFKEAELSPWIKKWIEGIGFKISDLHAQLIAENLGNDLSRIVNESEKLLVALPKGSVIDDEAIEKYIGISREYNSFELLNAIQQYQLPKAVKIIDHFSKNPKSGPLPMVIGSLYSFFSKLWLFYQLSPEEKGNKDIVNKTIGGYFHAMNVKNATRFYSPQKSEKIISLIAEYDLKSKGVNNKNASESELMLELVYQIMH